MWARVRDGKVIATFNHERDWFDEDGKKHPKAMFGSKSYRAKMGIVKMTTTKPPMLRYQAYNHMDTVITDKEVTVTYSASDIPLMDATTQFIEYAERCIEGVRAALADHPSSSKAGEYVRKAIATLTECPTEGRVFDAMTKVALSRKLPDAKALYDLWKSMDEDWFVAVLGLEELTENVRTIADTVSDCDQLREQHAIFDENLYQVRLALGLVSEDEIAAREALNTPTGE